MERITFKLRTITPTFLAGYDPTLAEMRVPSLRGMLRFWLRAAVGAVVGTDPPGLKIVHQEEGRVFGSTRRGSPVWPEIEMLAAPASDRHPHPSSEHSGLYWSMGRNRNRPPRGWLPAGTEFLLHLNANHLGAAPEARAWDKAIAALWLLTHLGGIGSRRTRAAGSLIVTSYLPGRHPPTVNFAPQWSPAALQKHLCTELENILALWHNLQRPPRTASSDVPEDAQASKAPGVTGVTDEPPSFDTLANGACKIWVLRNPDSNLGAWNTSEDALDDLAYQLNAFEANLSLKQRVAFGLPAPGVGIEDDQRRRLPDAVRRHTSPISFRVMPIGDRSIRYVLVAVLFRARFLPTGKHLYIYTPEDPQGDTIASPDADGYATLEDFIQTSYPNALEVWS